MTSPAAWTGPSGELLALQGHASAAPSYAALSDDELDRLRAQIVEATDPTDLPAETLAFLRRCVDEVEAGLSGTTPPLHTSDWAAEDAELDAEDREAKAAVRDLEDGWVGLEP